MMLDAVARPIHFASVRTTDVTTELVQLDEVIEWLHASDDNDVITIEGLIKEARHQVEMDTNLAIGSQTWTYTYDRAPVGGVVWLPVGPVASVTSVTSYSTADASSVVATSVYRVDTSSLPARIVLKDGQSWPSGLRPQDAFAVVYVAGYATLAAVPANLVTAMNLLIRHWFDVRTPVVVGTSGQELPLMYSAIIEPLRVRAVW